MKQRVATLSSKGQITIPAEIREALQLREGDKVAFELEGDQVRLAPQGSGSVVERTAGALRSNLPALSAEEERAAAEQAIAEEAVNRMGA